MVQYLSVDDILPFVGEFGRFQKIVEAILCVVMIPTTFQTLIMYFAALKPDWKCSANLNNTICVSNATFPAGNESRCEMPRNEWTYVQSRDYSMVTQFDLDCDDGWLINVMTSILFIGWAVGAVVLGWVADHYGRRIVFLPSVIAVILIGFATSFVENVWLLVFLRFAVGFVIPGALVQSYVIASELVSGRYRPFNGTMLWLFFAIGLCIMGLKAYFIRQWKILYIVCTIPYIVVVAFCIFVPESIRWLRIQNRIPEATSILQRIGRWNKKSLPEDVRLQPAYNATYSNKVSVLDLFRPLPTAASTLVQGFGWFMCGLLFYGLSLAADDLGGSLYLNFVLASAIEFPGHVLAIVSCNRLGRKKTTMWTMILGGVACAMVAAIPSSGGWRYFRVCLGMGGKFFATITFDGIYTWSAEIFPTNMRAEAFGFLQIAARMGSASAPWVS